MRMRLDADGRQAGKRLDQALKECQPDLSRARLQKCIKAGQCLINNEVITRPDYRLRPGDAIDCMLAYDEENIQAEDGGVPIIWHDQYLAVCDKAAGLTVHPCPSCPQNTVIQRLLGQFPQLRSMGGSRPGIVHRLDKDTSGLLLVALDEDTRLKMTAQFAAREVRKEYLALVSGNPPEHGECDSPIGRHPTLKTRMALVPASHGGRHAHTAWDKLWQSDNGEIALLKTRITTGRTHQIRVHLASLGFPLLGDQTYAPASVAAMAPRQMLHAWQLSFTHPVSGEAMRFRASPPEDFFEAIAANSRQMLKVVVTGNQGCGKSSFCAALKEAGLPTASADAMVAGLYSGPGHVADWLAMHGAAHILKPDGSVDKTRLLAFMEQSPANKESFNKFVHSLVFDQIREFWQQRENAGDPVAIMEIPLYFECAGQRQFTRPPVVAGVHCPMEQRWERLRQSRGWSMEKIRKLESWQMPEDKKMSLCDVVYDNSGQKGDMAAAAPQIIQNLLDAQKEREKATLNQLRKQCL